MSKREQRQTVILLILISLVMLVAAFIEPCDGHSCDSEVTHESR
jgi:hypothetical protein